ncbi:DUF3164 family protein [Idiomarina sp.]|uniref:DUF3164 family protein n=1 Tax=Idiomarina sp. TaxID=1874361 RepID=UPI0025C3B752|nr:DUF3164 family protein [Idiomarina sp.]NQZ03620.1 DUF3164 family protein [Idiomarina sp.]|tara:strand:+ start:89 stop:691 length:603 start_codon:yes stop_codon:yes gene_type:complete
MQQEQYKKDAKGRLIPIDQIHELDILKDDFVNEMVTKAKEKNGDLKAFKKALFDDFGTFMEMIAERYQTSVGGKKGNVTIYSFDGRYKLSVAVQDRITLGPELQVAEKLIKECVRDWSQDARSELKTLVERVFETDKEGNINTREVLALRRYEIEDERWQKAMDAISDAINVVGSKEYMRFYERDSAGDYKPISVDFTKV